MSKEKKFRPLFVRFGVSQYSQTITVAAASTSALSATEITNYGNTFIDSTGTGTGQEFTLQAPSNGISKTISVHGPGGSTVPVGIQTNSSSVTIGGSTANKIIFSTAITDGDCVSLIGASTSEWYLGGALPTGVTLSAATQAS